MKWTGGLKVLLIFVLQFILRSMERRGIESMSHHIDKILLYATESMCVIEVTE
jgi:hypothetical protein